MFKRNKLNSLVSDVAQLKKQYNTLSEDYKFLKDKVDYIIVKKHCPICGSEMCLKKETTTMYWRDWENIVGYKYHLTCPTDNYTVSAPTLKEVFDKVPDKIN